jgi:hypothetical protein
MPDDIITVWKKKVRKNKDIWLWEHNHISYGYDKNITHPTPISDLQKQSWPNSEWKSFKAKLIVNKVILN